MGEDQKNVTALPDREAAGTDPVKTFLGRVWEHSLVDKNLRRHREGIKTAANEVFEAFGVEPEHCVAIPVGSMPWGVDEETDYDFIVVTDDYDTYAKMTRKLKDYVDDQQSRVTRHRELLDVMQVAYSGKISDPSNVYLFIPLFLVPDDYLGGNLEVAAQARLNAIRYFEKLSEQPGFGHWDWRETLSGAIEGAFDTNYRHWDSHIIEREEKRDIPFESTADREERLNLAVANNAKRLTRIKRLLAQRKSHSGNPGKVEVLFNESREKIKPPSYEEYRQAILADNGHLRLRNNRFLAASGIREDFKPKKRKS